ARTVPRRRCVGGRRRRLHGCHRRPGERRPRADGGCSPKLRKSSKSTEVGNVKRLSKIVLSCALRSLAVVSSWTRSIGSQAVEPKRARQLDGRPSIGGLRVRRLAFLA